MTMTPVGPSMVISTLSVVLSPLCLNEKVTLVSEMPLRTSHERCTIWMTTFLMTVWAVAAPDVELTTEVALAVAVATHWP
ncbi:MAG: hypothetical protein OEY55_10250, partial [Acidimicrobiia bacterium]|nr:hypothetical protein [Acidimicrobiia bacterium]